MMDVCEQLVSTAVATNISVVDPSSSRRRKSLSSLTAAAADSKQCSETERETETPDNQGRDRDSRKSTASSQRGSFGSSGDATVFNSHSRPSLRDNKKASEDNDLPSYVSKSKNARFHKLFKNVPLQEYPIDTYSCAFKGDILLQGMMYVSQNWVCFYSKIRARGRLLEIPLEKVITITREKLALIIPNAIGIQMADHKYVFGSFISRDNTYKLLVTLLKHAHDSMNMEGRRSLSVESHDPDDITHSADVSAESDSTEDDDDDSNVQERVGLNDASQSSSIATPLTESREEARLGSLNGDKVPGFFSWKCMDYRKMFKACSTLTFKLQKIPRTNLLLAICSILVVFLLLSAAGLAYKILILQTRLEMTPLSSQSQHSAFRESSVHSQHWERERTSLQYLHDVLKANLQLLEQVHQSLKKLESSTVTKPCPPG